MGYYSTIQDAKLFLKNNGFEISANVFGEIEYLNSYGDKLTMCIYKDNSCKLW